MILSYYHRCGRFGRIGSYRDLNSKILAIRELPRFALAVGNYYTCARSTLATF